MINGNAFHLFFGIRGGLCKRSIQAEVFINFKFVWFLPPAQHSTDKESNTMQLADLSEEHSPSYFLHAAFLFGLLFYPEDWGNLFLRKFDWL